MSGIGSTELILLILLALIVVGPEKTKEMISLFGKAVRTFKSTIATLKENSNCPEEIKEIKNEIDDMKTDLTITKELSEIENELNYVKNASGGKNA